MTSLGESPSFAIRINPTRKCIRQSAVGVNAVGGALLLTRRCVCLEAGIAKRCLGAKIVDIAMFQFNTGLLFTAPKVPYQFARAHVLHAPHHLVSELKVS